MIQEIIDLLYNQKTVYSKLLELSKEKQVAIIAGDAPKVNDIVKLEWEQLNIATEIERKRVNCVQSIIENNKLDTDSLTISQISEFGTLEEKKVLEQLKNGLLAVIDEQKDVNEKSKGILDLHFEYMDFMVNNFLKETQLSNIYGNSGSLTDTTSDNKGLIDNQA